MASPGLLESPETDLLEGIDRPWNVVVHNDPVNLMSYVTMVFRRLFGWSRGRAEKHMMEVHRKGRSVVWSGVREKAEAYAFTLQQWHLTTVLEQDDVR